MKRTMIDQPTIEDALRANINWFLNSGIMNPADGLWGVAERIATTAGNNAIEKIQTSFPAWTEYEGYSVIEQRRADCNFETAMLFLLAEKALCEKSYGKTAENILDFLYFKSGLLLRTNSDLPTGSWNWSHIMWGACIWFDDNAWNGIIQFLIAQAYPELDKKYSMRQWARLVAESMLDGFQRTMETYAANPAENWSDPRHQWLGDLKLPHWGALPCMLFALAFSETGDSKFTDAIKIYFTYLWENRDNFISSEITYALLSASFISRQIQDSFYNETATYFADKIVEKMDPSTGNLPAEHYEAPCGAHLADLIYTVNWALLGLHAYQSINPNPKYREGFEKLLTFIIEIQDRTSMTQYHGCWRGMYDLKLKTWGGGDRYEGGAGSIYSGWTNAPIAWVLAYELLGSSLCHFSHIA